MSVPSMIRTRWAALGAAVAVALGAGSVGVLRATSPDGAAAFVPITPCRLFDTRPEPFNIGPRTAPLGQNDVHSVAGTGASGECELPDDATGLVLNVTAVDATQATFLTLYPAGEERPNASHLNPAPGAPPSPNAVTVDLGTDGTFSIFNRFGNVHVLADVVGYYTDHHHDDRYYTRAQHDADTAELADALDARVPRVASITLAGAGFAALGSPLVMADGTACTRAESAQGGTRHVVPLTAGAIVTALDVRAHNQSIYTQQFDVSLRAQRPGSADDELIHSETLTMAPGPGMLEARVELPAPELADAGEALYVEFLALQSVFLCSVEVEFTRPG